jgi:hypothetical protein
MDVSNQETYGRMMNKPRRGGRRVRCRDPIPTHKVQVCLENGK